MLGTATFDPKGIYRYRLTRCWDETVPAITWIMLNPSTADHRVDDATLRRVVGFSRSWGFGTVVVVNLFALIASRPGNLTDAPVPVGPDNDAAIADSVSGSGMVIAAWGNHGALQNPSTGLPRHGEVLQLLVAGSTNEIRCLGTTGSGQPRHPLYVSATTRPVPLEGWPSPGETRKSLRTAPL